MMALFVGGSADGETRLLSRVARHVLIPVPPQTARLEDYLNLDYRPEYKTDRYRCVWYDNENDEGVYLHERTE
jgi:hypothetical protein